MKKYGYLLLPLLACILFKGWFSYTHGFKIAKIHPGILWDSSWRKGFSYLPGEEQKEILRILDQPFSYLARGQQAYAFVSQDQKYVIKFLRLPKYRPSFWASLFYGFEEREIHKKNGLWQRCKESIQLAENRLKEESALIYAHLEVTTDMQKSLDLIGPLGLRRKIDLDSFAFVIQKRARLIGPYLLSQDEEGRKKILSSFVETISYRAHKNIRNKNRNGMKNLGVIEGKVVEFDVGELRENPEFVQPECFHKELERSSRQLKKWLGKHFPEEVAFLEKELETCR